MESQGNFSNNRHTVLLDISLFVLDMLSPEKIKSKYIQQDDGIVLEVPSAFITMIIDAQAGNLLLKEFIDANMVAVKNNPIHVQSQEPRIQELVIATNEKFEQIKERVYQTILTDFAPLIKDISKTDRIASQSETSASAVYPIQVYEPLMPVSTEELRALRLAYLKELNLPHHPLFDLYYLQIYHAQTTSSSETLLSRRELLSLGRTTYTTIKTWKQGPVGQSSSDHDDLHNEKRGSRELQVVDDSRELLRILVINYFRENWKSIVDTATGLSVDLVLTIAQSGGLRLDDVGVALVSLRSATLIAKGIKGIAKQDMPLEQGIGYIFLGLSLIFCVFLFYLSPEMAKSLLRFYSSPTSVVVLPQVIITVSELPQSTLTTVPTLEVVITNTTPSLSIEGTPTLITVNSQSTDQSFEIGYCMYVVQPGDSIQSVAARFQVAENDLRYYGKQVDLSIFEVNRMIEVSAPCCRQNANVGSSYTVRYGDDLYDISRQFFTTEDAIASVNNLHSPNLIFTGQMLCIPNQ